MDIMQFDHPNKQDIENFMKVQQGKYNKPAFSTSLPQTLAFSAYYMALFGAFFINVNPYGRASRIRYEQSLNPVWRYSRKLLPFGLLLGGLAWVDMQSGIL